MQQKHLAVLNGKDHARYSSMRKAAPHFPKATAKASSQRQAHRPGKLNVFNVLANDLSIARWQFPKPLAYRFPAARGAVKPRGQALENLVHKRQYHFWYAQSICILGAITDKEEQATVYWRMRPALDFGACPG